MAFKTVLKRLLSKKGILSVELVEAFKKDKSDGTTDGTLEMNFVGQEEEQPVAETAEEPKVEEKEQTSRKGRPSKVVANVVPDDSKPQATKPFDMKQTMEFDGDF